MPDRISAEARTFVNNPNAPCDACVHDFGSHAFYATDPTADDRGPSAGGILVCPEPECGCYVRWGTATEPGAFLPGADEVKAVQAHLRIGLAQSNGSVLSTFVQWARPDSDTDR
jgi:hypothetical protein